MTRSEEKSQEKKWHKEDGETHVGASSWSFELQLVSGWHGHDAPRFHYRLWSSIKNVSREIKTGDRGSLHPTQLHTKRGSVLTSPLSAQMTRGHGAAHTRAAGVSFNNELRHWRVYMWRLWCAHGSLPENYQRPPAPNSSTQVASPFARLCLDSSRVVPSLSLYGRPPSL